MLNGIKYIIAEHKVLVEELKISVVVSKADRINIKALKTTDALKNEISNLKQDKIRINKSVKELKHFYTHSGLMGIMLLILDTLKLHKAPKHIAQKELKKITKKINLIGG